MTKTKSCPCHSGKAYRDCCQPYHEGQLPPTAEALMRSRYSAYALCLTDYIIKTTHPLNPNHGQTAEQILSFCQNTEFRNLKILEHSEEGNTAYVAFRAGLKQQGQDASFFERSRFFKENGQWLYVDGELS